jgi:hypothetical protein
VIGEWNVDAYLSTPEGTLLLNQPESGGYFMLDEARCTGSLPVRAVSDNIPQGHGAITHKRWRGGYVIHLAIQLWETIGDAGEPACDQLLREMLDTLGLHVNALLNPPNGGRFVFTPTGYGDDRMLDQAQLLAVSPVQFDGAAPMVELDIDSPFPYYYDATQDQTSITDGVPVTITNAGNVDHMPVIHVFGPTNAFTVTNQDAFDDDGAPLQLVYDSTLPGGAPIASGDFVFFDFFRNVAYLNGDQNNRKAGIDPRYSDFFPLVPGGNEIEIVGADALVLSNSSWA